MKEVFLKPFFGHMANRPEKWNETLILVSWKEILFSKLRTFAHMPKNNFV